jgi:hypothetical protein
MADVTVLNQHHALQQNLGDNNGVLKWLVGEQLYDINQAENLVILSNNWQLAAQTDTGLHVSNHAPIAQASAIRVIWNTPDRSR